MNENQLKFLWDNYANNKGFSGYDEFKSLMANDNSRKVFFENSNKELGFKDYNEFEGVLGVKKKEGTQAVSGQPVQQPGKPSAPSFGQKVTEKITNSASQTQVPLKTGLQVQEEKKTAEKKAKIPTSKYFEVDVEEKKDQAQAPKFADPIVVAKNSQKSKAVFNSVIGDKDIYKMPTAGESRQYATDITSGYLDYLELVGSDKSDTYKEKYSKLKAKPKADRSAQDEEFLRQVESEAVGAFYDAKEWELSKISSEIDNLQKTAVTDEEKAQLNNLYGQYEKKRDSLLGTSSVYAQNKLQYGKIAGREMADEEDKLRRFQALQAGDGKTIEFFKGIGGAVANGVLSVAQVPKVFGDLIGDTDYDWSDEMYDMVSGQKANLDREFGAPLPKGKNMSDLPLAARLAVVGGNAIGSAGLFAAGGGLIGATSNLGKAAATFGTAFLTSEAGYYQDALDAGMSPQEAALAGTYLAAQTAIIESIIPDIKYFEPSAFRKSVMQAVSSGIKSGLPVKEAAKLALKNTIKAAPESALAYSKTGIKEAGEELLGQVGEDIGKETLNAVGQRQYFNDTFNPESYTDAILGGFIAGGGMSVFSRPTPKSPVQEEVMREIVERRPQETQKGTASDKINKEDLSALDDVTEIYNAMSSHSGWNVMSREEQNHALAVAQQAQVMKKEQERMKELRIPDERKDAEIKRLEDEVNQMFSMQMEQDKQKAKDAKLKAIEDEFNKSMEGEEFPVQEDERDQEIIELQKLREERGVSELDTFLGDMKPMVPFAVERTEQGLPVAQSVKQAASNYLYKKYKELTEMKSDPNRMMTRGQIASVQKQLEQDIRILEGTAETKTEARDQENIQGIPSEVGVGEKPVQAEPVEVPSTEAPEAGGVLQAQEEVAGASLRDVELKMRRPEKNEIVFVSIDALLQKHAVDQPSYDIQKEGNRIKGRVEKAKEFIKNYIKDQRAINPRSGERMNGKVSFEPSVVDIDANGKISFEDGRHRVLAAKEMGLTEVPIEVPKEKAKTVEQLLGKPKEVTPTTEAAPEIKAEGKPTAPVTEETKPTKPTRKERISKLFEEEQVAPEAEETTVSVEEEKPTKKTGKSGVQKAPTEGKKPSKKAPEIAPAPRRAGSVEATEGDNPIAGAENTLTAAGMNETSLSEWKKANEKDSKKGRIEELAELVRNLMSGKIKFKDYYERAKQIMPSKLMDKVPAITSFKEIVGSIDRNKLEKGVINLNKFIKKGTRVGLRIDIPAFNRFGKNVVTVHEGKGSRSPIGYGSTGSIQNVTFRTSVSTAAKIGTGEDKSAFAMAVGEWMDESPESIQARAQEALNSPEWIQVGMNPIRSSFFFDKADGNPVVSADEVLQVGNLVLAKNAKKIDLNTKEGMTEFEKMFSAKTKEGVTYQYRRTGQGFRQRLSAMFDTEGERAAEDLAKFYEGTGIDVEIIDDVEAQRLGQERNIEGNLEGLFIADKDSGKIYLNRDALKRVGKTLVYHEGIHPVINIIRNTNPELYKKVLDGIRSEAKRNPAIARAIRQIESVKEYQKRGPEAIEDETIVEVLARIAARDIDLSKVNKTLKDDLIDFWNKIAKALRLPTINPNASTQEFRDFAKKLSTALTEGGKLADVVGAENITEFAPPPSLGIKEKENISNYEEDVPIPGIIRAGQASVEIDRSTNSPIDVYQEKGVKKLPVKTLKQIYDKFNKKVVVINSDPTRVGWLTLPSGKRIFMYGGPGYLSVLDNTKGDIGFATTQESKVRSWKKYVDELFGKNPGVTLIATQAPTAILSNSYALRYVLDAISQLPKSVLKSKTFKSEFFGNDVALLKDAFGDKKYNEFINKYKNADLSNPEIIDNMISEMSYTVGDNNAPASFKARGAFVANLLGGLGEKSKSQKIEGDKGYYSKKPQKYIASELMNRLGINAEKVIRDIGEPGLVDLYMNEGKWGFAVSGFETDPNMDISSIQNLGVTHPLFNAKFPGKNAFLLDGAYEIDAMFEPIQMTGPKGEPYTKRASLMLAGSMYVKGEIKQGEQTFKYGVVTPSGIGVLPVVTPERITKASENLQAKFRRDGIPLSKQEAIEIVEELASWKDWYEGIAQMVQDNFGEYAADYMMFMFGSAVAADSAGTIGTALNNLERLYAQEEIKGLPIMKRNIYEILSGLPVSSDKISNFIAAGLGDKNAIPVDMHVWSFINSFPETKGPTKKDFDKAKEFVRAVADGLGWDPREVQAAMWAANMLRLGQRPDTYEEYIQKKIDAGLQEQIQGWRDKGYKPVFAVRQAGEKIETVFLQEEKKTEFAPKLEEVKRAISPKGQPSVSIDRSGVDYFTKNGKVSFTNIDVPKGFNIVSEQEGWGRLYDQFDRLIMQGDIRDIGKRIKAQYPVGTPKIKDATTLDLYSNIDKFTLKQLGDILQQLDPEGEWSTMAEDVDSQPSQGAADKLETSLLADARKSLSGIVDDMLKADKADEYIGFDIEKDGLGSSEKPKTKLGQLSAQIPRTPSDVRQAMEDSGDAVEQAIASGTDPQTAVDDLIGSQDWYNELSPRQKEQFDEILQDEFGVTPRKKTKAQMASIEETAKALEGVDLESLFEKTKSTKYFRGQPVEELPKKDIFISPNEIVGKMYTKGTGVLKKLSLKTSNLFDIDTIVTNDFNDKLIDAWRKSSRDKTLVIPKDVLNGNYVGSTYSQSLKEDEQFRRALEGMGYDGLLNNFTRLKLHSQRQEVIVFDQSNVSEINADLISELYHKAKEDGSNPELVRAVEDLIGKPEIKTAKTTKTEVGENIKNIVDNYYKLKEGSIQEKRAAKAAINEILDADPKLKYIYDNISSINKQLQDAGVITDKTDGCP